MESEEFTILVMMGRSILDMPTTKLVGTGLDVATCGVANVTSFYSVATKFSHLVANLAPQDR